MRRAGPIHVIARNHKMAEQYVITDLGEDRRRLHYIDRPDNLRGKKGWVVHIHPTAHEHPHYVELMQMIRLTGSCTLTFDDSAARALYQQQQEQRPCKTPLPTTTVTAPSKTSRSRATAPPSMKP
jgi:hypothetical protein